MRPGNPAALEQPYDPMRVEARWYSFWEGQGYFAAGLDTFEFARTVSRLHEMQSREYLEAPRRSVAVRSSDASSVTATRALNSR